MIISLDKIFLVLCKILNEGFGKGNFITMELVMKLPNINGKIYMLGYCSLATLYILQRILFSASIYFIY